MDIKWHGDKLGELADVVQRALVAAARLWQALGKPRDQFLELCKVHAEEAWQKAERNPLRPPSSQGGN